MGYQVTKQVTDSFDFVTFQPTLAQGDLPGTAGPLSAPLH
jgi:hypothetical protein